MTSSYRPSRNRSPERGSYHGSIPRGPRERRSPRRDDHDGRKMPAQSGRRSPLYYERSSTYRPNYDLLDSPRSPHGPQRPAMDHDRNPGDATAGQNQPPHTSSMSNDGNEGARPAHSAKAPAPKSILTSAKESTNSTMPPDSTGTATATATQPTQPTPQEEQTSTFSLLHRILAKATEYTAVNSQMGMARKELQKREEEYKRLASAMIHEKFPSAKEAQENSRTIARNHLRMLRKDADEHYAEMKGLAHDLSELLQLGKPKGNEPDGQKMKELESALGSLTEQSEKQKAQIADAEQLIKDLSSQVLAQEQKEQRIIQDANATSKPLIEQVNKQQAQILGLEKIMQEVLSQTKGQKLQLDQQMAHLDEQKHLIKKQDELLLKYSNSHATNGFVQEIVEKANSLEQQLVSLLAIINGEGSKKGLSTYLPLIVQEQAVLREGLKETKETLSTVTKDVITIKSDLGVSELGQPIRNISSLKQDLHVFKAQKGLGGLEQWAERQEQLSEKLNETKVTLRSLDERIKSIETSTNVSDAGTHTKSAEAISEVSRSRNQALEYNAQGVPMNTLEAVQYTANATENGCDQNPSSIAPSSIPACSNAPSIEALKTELLEVVASQQEAQEQATARILTTSFDSYNNLIINLDERTKLSSGSLQKIVSELTERVSRMDKRTHQVGVDEPQNKDSFEKNVKQMDEQRTVVSNLAKKLDEINSNLTQSVNSHQFSIVDQGHKFGLLTSNYNTWVLSVQNSITALESAINVANAAIPSIDQRLNNISTKELALGMMSQIQTAYPELRNMQTFITKNTEETRRIEERFVKLESIVRDLSSRHESNSNSGSVNPEALASLSKEIDRLKESNEAMQAETIKEFVEMHDRAANLNERLENLSGKVAHNAERGATPPHTRRTESLSKSHGKGVRHATRVNRIGQTSREPSGSLKRKPNGSENMGLNGKHHSPLRKKARVETDSDDSNFEPPQLKISGDEESDQEPTE